LSITDTDHIVNQLESEIQGIKSWIQWMWFVKKFFLRLTEIDAWDVEFAIQQLQKSIE